MLAGRAAGVAHLRYMHEFQARARFQGQLLNFTFTVPIDQLIEGIGTVFE